MILLVLAASSSVFFGVNMLGVSTAQTTAVTSYEAIREAAGMPAAIAEQTEVAVASTALQIENTQPTSTESPGALAATPIPTAAVRTSQELAALDHMPDFAALQAVNSDIVGWIYQEGTEIDYPLMYSAERSYYLTRLYTGESNKHGSIYIDPENSPDMSDRNTLIYGHNMKDKTMFGSLYRYQEQAYFDQHPVMAVYTPGHTYLLELFAVHKIDIARDAPQTELVTDLEVSRYATAAKNQSLVTCDLMPELGERLVTLVTCTTRDEQRLLVVGRLREL